MIKKVMLGIIYFILISPIAFSKDNVAVTRSISPESIVGFENYPVKTKALIIQALRLADKNLFYQYGSADPKNGGMDCSGTIFYLLHSFGFNPPRQANEMYSWLNAKGNLKILTNKGKKSFLNNISPGNLLFWTGTYNVSRVPPITHVMMYLGVNKLGQILIFGASNGRYFKNTRINGVSVFTLKLSSKKTRSTLVAYGCLPEMSCKNN